MMKMLAIAAVVGTVGLSAPAFAQSHALTQAEVDGIVAGKRAELEACLAHMPTNPPTKPQKPEKKPADVVLSLEIDDTGEVQTVAVTNVSDDVERCIAVAAVEWDFPSTDVKADASTFKCQLLGAHHMVKPAVAAH
jgi:hypothetical protein